MIILFVAVALHSPWVSAQYYPSKPVHLAVAFVPGGPTDPIGRRLAQTLSERFGQSFLCRDPGYQLQRDVTPITLVESSPDVFVTALSTPANALEEFIRDSKSQHITHATAGIGTTPHLSGYQLLHLLARLDAVDDPYRGGAPAITAATGEQVTLASVTFAP